MSDTFKGKCLFIATHDPMDLSIKSGGAALTRSNFDLLKELFEVEAVHSLPAGTASLFSKLIRFLWALFGYLGGNTPRFERQVGRLVQTNNYKLVFIDHGVLGRLAKIIKTVAPATKVVIHFHNVEADYYWNLFKTTPVIGQVLQSAARKNEELAHKWADGIIALTREDQTRFQELYGEFDRAIIPVGGLSISTGLSVGEMRPNYLLFCGSYFGPNIEGLIWFVKEILPKIPYELVVIGYGMEQLAQTLQHNRLKIVGTVSETLPYYQQAIAVINPVLSGAGMNVKSIEAIGLGVNFLSTPIGLRGIPTPWPGNIHCFTNFAEFKLGLQAIQDSHSLISPESIAYYLKTFSQSARLQILLQYLSKKGIVSVTINKQPNR